MAYVLGYFCADGCMFTNSGGSKYISFVSTDRELLEKVKRILKSTHKIAPKKQSRPNCRPTYWIQIGCKEIYEDIARLGLTPKKELRLRVPDVPSEHFWHFLRGYFDGDGCVTCGYYKRKNRKSKVFILTVRFVCASKGFLEDISRRLEKLLGIKSGFITKREGCFCLTYSKAASVRLFEFFYKDTKGDFYLERKFNKFRQAVNSGTWCSLV